MSNADLVNAHNEGYNRGYAKAQAENEQLKAQIEKMQNCWNCKEYCNGNLEKCGNTRRIDREGAKLTHLTFVCDKWKLKE